MWIPRLLFLWGIYNQFVILLSQHMYRSILPFIQTIYYLYNASTISRESYTYMTHIGLSDMYNSRTRVIHRRWIPLWLLPMFHTIDILLTLNYVAIPPSFLTDYFGRDIPVSANWSGWQGYGCQVSVEWVSVSIDPWVGIERLGATPMPQAKVRRGSLVWLGYFSHFTRISQLHKLIISCMIGYWNQEG